MYYSDDVIEQVRSRSDIVDVISTYVKLKRQGSTYFGLCPFHSEKSPSFSVTPSKQMYYCFGCGAGGNVITFVMQYENYSFTEALQMLADRAGITLPQQEMSEQSKREHDLRSRILEVNKTAAAYYYYMLRSKAGETGMEYLKRREISDETMHRFGLGFAGVHSDGLYRYMKSKGYSDQLLRDSGLMSFDEKRGMYDKFWNRVIFPIMDINNRVIGFGGRVMGDAKPKYLNSPETKVFDKGRNLYGLNAARSSRKKVIIVCEGYMDVIAMHQAGFTNAVASLGTALTSQHASLLKRYTDEVILSYDSDQAGIKATMRAIPLMQAAGIRTRILRLAPYKDPDEFIKAQGAEAFQKRLDEAVGSFFFELEVMQSHHDMSDPEAKTAFFKEVAERIAQFELEVERENYIEAAANKYNTSFEGLRKMVIGALMKGTGKQTVEYEEKRPREKKAADSGLLQSQRLLLTWLCEYPGFYPVLSKYVSVDDYADEFYQSAARMLYSMAENGNMNPASIINQFEDPEDQNKAAQIMNTSIQDLSAAEQIKAMKETIRKVAEASMRSGQDGNGSQITDLQRIIEKKRRLGNLEREVIDLGKTISG